MSAPGGDALVASVVVSGFVGGVVGGASGIVYGTLVNDRRSMTGVDVFFHGFIGAASGGLWYISLPSYGIYKITSVLKKRYNLKIEK